MCVAEVLIISAAAVYIYSFIKKVETVLIGYRMTARSEGAGTESDRHVLFRVREGGMNGNFSCVLIPNKFGSIGRQFGGIALIAYHAVESKLIILLHKFLALVSIPP